MDLPTPAEIASLRVKNRWFLKLLFLLSGILILFITWAEVHSTSTLSFRERKKSIDSKVRVLREIKDSFPDKDLVNDFGRIENSFKEVESAFKTGTQKEKSDSLLSIEKKLPESLRKWSETAAISSDRLLQYVARETQLRGLDTEERHPLTAKEEEKVNQYFHMAREEWLSGNKFRRDGNHLYALVLYKRSLKYSFSSLKTSKLPPPIEFKKVGERLTSHR
ncbi:PROCN domain protein [Leptospira perolatii]|uniref:PROCN domain protein n=2 Tax=Leptospira perolatii TaxID=2023191 RepID=A0A2M9ZJZ0_9LEPT|nr:PROCN domain protein [Leptospira perolatii]PJZ72368.1 PROCN domain protein [Leptospira perolatii]